MILSYLQRQLSNKISKEFKMEADVTEFGKEFQSLT